MEILLLRHGRSLTEDRLRLSSSAFGRWVADYDAAGIDPQCPPPEAATKAARRCRWVVCSDLPRSVASAQALGVRSIDLVHGRFREFGMPYLQLGRFKLSAHAWSAIYRLAWMAGFSANAESFAQARLRARGCADQLAALAGEHQRVLFVGHGMLLWYLGRTLRSRGWSAGGKGPRRHWESVVYRYG